MPESESSRLRRAIRFIQILSQQKNGLSVYDLAQLEGLSEKTIRRDLKLLQDEGIDIKEELADHGKKLWRITANVEQVSFTFHELFSLYMGRRLLEPFAGTPFFEGIHSLFQKLEAQLFHESRALQDQLANLFYLTNVGASDYTSRSHLISQIMSSIQDRRVLKISYLKNTANKASDYSVHPYTLVYHRGSLYIIGFSESSNAMRHFKLDRVEEAATVGHSYEIPTSFDVREYLNESFGIFSPSGESKKVRVHFAAEAAGAVKESRWNRSQKFVDRKDGSTVMSLVLRNLDEIKSWILSFGPLARVLEPVELIEALRSDIKHMNDSYDPNSVGRLIKP